MNMFKIESDKKLFYLRNESWVSVKLEPCFPISKPERFFSVRTDKGQEIHLFETVTDFSSSDQIILREYLAFKNFEFKVEGIYSIEEDFGVRNFKVKTTKGDRSFQTELDEWPEQSENGEISITDVYGERFVMAHLEFGETLLHAYI